MTMPGFLPPGSAEVARWALSQRLQYAGHPDERSLRQWEPFDTMVSPARFFNVVSQLQRRAALTVVEPWTEEGMEEPMDRTLLGYVVHPELRGRASIRAGAHFISRVSFLTDPPPPKVKLGISGWDDHIITHSPSLQHAQAALTPALRKLLASWSFSGHLELKPGGLIVHYADCRPSVDGYLRMGRALPQLRQAALTPPR